MQINTQSASLSNLSLVYADQVVTGTYRGARPVPNNAEQTRQSRAGTCGGDPGYQVTSLGATAQVKLTTSIEPASWLGMPSLPPELKLVW